MNREYDYSELIDDYLTGKLSEKQKLELEFQLQKDPDLKKDFLVQKDIVNGIKAARKAELKSMLNNVNVGAGSSGFNYFPLQIAGAVLITSILAVGTYYYFAGEDQHYSDASPVYVEPTPPINGSATIETQENPLVKEENKITEAPNTITEESIIPAESSKNEVSGEIPEKLGQETATEEPGTQQPTIEQPITETSDPRPGSNLNVETKRDRNHAFHYQYYEDKLFLYGDFKGNTYEIIKLPSSTGTKLFMSYDGRFYKMDKSRKIKAFEPVEDTVIIEQLQKLKTK